MKFAARLAAGLFAGSFAAVAWADMVVGVTVSITGPATSLGLPEKNALAFAPQTIAGEKVTYVVLDDATDPTSAAKNVQKLITERKVDIVLGSSTVPTSLAAAAKAAEGRTPLIAMAPLRATAEQLPWVFATPQPVAIMADAVVRHMKAAGVSSLGFVGYNDPYGEDWARNMTQKAEAAGIKIVASERYNRTDTSVTGQALKLVSANPDAVFIGASGTPSVLPQSTLLERGYKGRIYQSHGSANSDYLRVAGKNAEGTLLPVGPVLVAEQLPDAHLAKKPALEYVKAYESAHGAGSRNTFGAHAFDAVLLLQRAAPEALKKARPGTPEFRQALRDALEAIREMPASHGVFSLSGQDHTGLDGRAVVMVNVEGGAWKIID